MGYRQLTLTGKNFITTICSDENESLLSGSNNYNLAFSSKPKGEVYTAKPKDRYDKNIITTNSKLGEELIYWFESYCGLYDLDANIIAAQAYVESGFKLWAFPNSKMVSSSAQGITQFLSSTLYDVVIGNKGVSKSVSIGLFNDDEISRITKDLEEPRNETSYIYNNNAGGLQIALNNRDILFQNCMDNPDLMIKAQCRLMKAISIKAGNNAASTLFGYNQGSAYVRGTFTSTLKNSEPDNLTLTRYNAGIEYINKVFRVLGDENYNNKLKPKGLWFGYKNFDFTFDPFTANVLTSNSDIRNDISLSSQISINYTLGDLTRTSTGLNNVPTQNEFNKLKIFAEKILEPLNKHFNTVFEVNSSFRSDVVNTKVGGVITSQHKEAEAADIRLEINNNTGYTLREVFDRIVSGEVKNTNKDFEYDQIIFETKGNTYGQTWIHISYNSDDPSKNREEAKTATLINDKMVYNDLK